MVFSSTRKGPMGSQKRSQVCLTQTHSPGGRSLLGPILLTIGFSITGSRHLESLELVQPVLQFC